jgi:hypothetical protein
MEKGTEPGPNLDSRTVHFTLKADEELRAGDALIIRDIQRSNEGWIVAAVPEQALKDEAAKVFS